MDSKFATTSTATFASNTSLHPHFTFRDRLCIVLFLTIPIYTQFCISPSISSTVKHIYIISTTGVCIVHFSGDVVSLGQVKDVVWGLVISSFYSVGKSYSLTAWILPNMEGWRGVFITWAAATTSLIFLLPDNYGRDVQALSEEYKHACPSFTPSVACFSGFLCWCFSGGREYSWLDILVVWAILSSFVEYVYLIRLNYICLCTSGKTVRENSWPYKDKFKRPGRFMNGYGEELTFKEMLEWHSTGKISSRARRDKVGAGSKGWMEKDMRKEERLR